MPQIIGEAVAIVLNYTNLHHKHEYICRFSGMSPRQRRQRRAAPPIRFLSLLLLLLVDGQAARATSISDFI